VYLYSALFVVPHTQGAQAWITQCYLQLHQCLPILRLRISNCSVLLIYLPRKDERLSRPGCLTYSGGGVECRWGRRNNAILDEYLASLHTGLQCCQPYESQSVKKAATNGGKRRAHRGVRCPLFAQEDDEVFVTGSTLYVGDDGRSNNRRQQNRI